MAAIKKAYAEQVQHFGRSRSLIGVVTLPAGQPRARGPAVIFVNTGIVHRIGHHRKYVVLARRLAAAGHHVLRFDLSGIGDSRSPAGKVDILSTWFADLSDAYDLLERQYAATQFVVIGLCAGADIALRFGQRDARTVGLALLDPTVPPTARFYLDYIKLRLTSLRSWLTFVTGRGRLWRDLRFYLQALPRRSPDGTGLVDPRTQAQLAHLYGSLIDRRAQLLVILTGDQKSARQSYREQFLDAFPTVRFDGALRLEYFPSSDHVFSDAADRERLYEIILAWMTTTAFRPEGSDGAGDRTRSDLDRAADPSNLARQPGGEPRNATTAAVARTISLQSG